MTRVPERTRSSLWRHRDFLLLWAGQSVSEAGSAVTVLALPLTAVVVLQASTFQVGLLSAATTAAFLVVALPAGAVVDRLAKRRLMLVCDAARLLIVGSVPLAAAIGVLGMAQLYAVALLAGLATVFFDVAYQSYVPSLVSREQLMDANGKMQTTAEAARLTGPGLGGGLVALAGAAGAMTADAASYAVSVASLLLIRTHEQPASRTRASHRDAAESGPASGTRASQSGAAAHGLTSDGRQQGARREDGPSKRPGGERGNRPRDQLRGELTAGLAFVLREPILRKIVACTGTANLFGSMGVALEIVFLVRVLHVPPAVTGLIVALAALGGVAGGASSQWLARRIGSARIIWVSTLAFGPVGLLIPLSRPGWGVLFFVLGWFGFSFTGVVYNVAQLSYRQAVCPPQLLGRMNSAVRWIVWGTLPLGGLLGGILGSAFGIRATLFAAAAGAWAAGLWVFFSPLRGMRDVPPPGTYVAGTPAGGPAQRPAPAVET